MKEKWIDILQDDKYQVSSFWRIKKKWYLKLYKNWSFRYSRPDKIISPCVSKYYRVSIKNKQYSVHRLVAQAFLWLDIDNKKLFVCHKDDNTYNNIVTNLFIWYAKDNTQDMISKWRFVWNKKIKNEDIPKIREMIKLWITQIEISKIFWVSRSCISMISNWTNFKNIK